MFPTIIPVMHRTFVKVGENAAGQDITEPSERRRLVCSLKSRRFETATHTDAALADRSVNVYSMVTPDSDWPHGSEVVDQYGRVFVVDGDAAGYNDGPFGFTPGFIVALRRVVQNDGAGVS